MTLNRHRQRLQSVVEGVYDRFLELIIYPSVWVALALASLGIYAQTALGLTNDWQPILLIFFTALIPYNLDRIFDSYIQKIPDDKAQLFFRQPFVLILLFGAIAGAAFLLYSAPQGVRYVSLAGIFPLLYGAPVFPSKRSEWHWYRLKDIPGSKAWIVGLIITYAVVALPLAYGGVGLDANAVLITLFLFVFIVTNSHIFDIRDLESDRQKGVVTLPILIDVSGTKWLLSAMNLSVMLVPLFLRHSEIAFHLEIILATAVNILYVALVNTNTPRWVYNILIESCLFIPFLYQWAIAS
ncbi:MAG: UbiA family prenyltransferase [Cyanobacteria bacterium J06600_6]